MKNETISNQARPIGLSERLRWMVIDDNEEMLNLLALFLSYAGDMVVYSFPSAREALKAFCATPEAWELVITDLEMPGMDGLDLSAHLWAINPDLNIFLMTGSGIITEEEAVEQGFGGLLRKPFQFSALLRLLLAARATDVAQTAKETGRMPSCVAV